MKEFFHNLGADCAGLSVQNENSDTSKYEVENILFLSPAQCYTTRDDIPSIAMKEEFANTKNSNNIKISEIEDPSSWNDLKQEPLELLESSRDAKLVIREISYFATEFLPWSPLS